MNDESNSHSHQPQIAIIGAGLSGLSLAVACLDEGIDGREIIIFDPRTRWANDRTWCYWDLEGIEHSFLSCEHCRWTTWELRSEERRVVARPDQSPPYLCFRSADVYAHALNRLERAEVRVIRAAVETVVPVCRGEVGRYILQTTPSANEAGTTPAGEAKPVFGREHAFRWVFDSRPPKMDPADLAEDLLQHFGGLFVKTREPTFDSEVASVMDFRGFEPSGEPLTFTYLLPFSATDALVETTCFGGDIKPPNWYEDAARDYLRRWIGVTDFAVVERELGRIPMYSSDFDRGERGWFRIGLAGGLARPSTGYAFIFIQEDSRDLAAQIRRVLSGCRREVVPARRAGWLLEMDRVLLGILRREGQGAQRVFLDLFDKADKTAVVRFLSDRPSSTDVGRVIAASPKGLFANEALRQLPKAARRYLQALFLPNSQARAK